MGGRGPVPAEARATLTEVVEELAAYERRAGSEGEHRAAAWIARRLRSAGCEATLEETYFHAGYAGLMRGACLAACAAGAAALAARRLRGPAAAVAALSGLAIADDISNGPRLARRLIQRREPTWNVIGSAGDLESSRTLVLLAHHDAAPTGLIFDPRLQAWVGEHFPALIERTDTAVPIWWPPLLSHGLIATGAATHRARLTVAGLSAAVFHDIARSPVVPGANDDLSGVAVLVALAERLRESPVTGLAVRLVSCGAEEVLQGGIHGFARDHFPGLDPEQTWFLNLETVGSPRLILLEGEGPIVMEDYHDRGFRDLVERCAREAGAQLQRGLRARSSTDAVIPSRAGYPTATLCSMNRYKALSNYHLMSDTPDNLDYDTIGAALTVTDALVRELAVHG
jgi:hypothetical protein